MNAKLRLLLISTVLAILAVACGAPAATEAPASEAPVPATEAPAATQPPATEPETSVTEEPAATEAPAFQICSATPDGLGQTYTSRPVATTYLGDAHGKFVYDDIVYQIERSSAFMVPTEVPQAMTDLVVILVVDTFSESIMGENQIVTIPEIESFIRGVDLYLDVETTTKGLLVVAVDTNKLSYDAISNNMPAAIEFFINYGDIVFVSDQGFDFRLPKATGIVVNMSFVFVPCNSVVFDVIRPVLGKLDASYPELELGGIADMDSLGENYQEGDNFYNYVNCIDPYVGDNCRQASGNLRLRLQELYADYETNEESKTLVDNAVFNAFVVDLAYDPDADGTWLNSFATIPCSTLIATAPSLTLQDCLKHFSQFGLGSVIPSIAYVGAAGNFEYPFPFPPASWDTVISVSSQVSTDETQPQILDSVTGLALAEYSNWGEVQMDGVYLEDSASDILGTSFAAPKFSFWAARYLLGQTFCAADSSRSPSSFKSSPPWDNYDYIRTCFPTPTPTP